MPCSDQDTRRLIDDIATGRVPPLPGMKSPDTYSGNFRSYLAGWFKKPSRLNGGPHA